MRTITMSTQRRLGYRQTAVHPRDRRVAGAYEQTVDCPTLDARYRLVAEQLAAAVSLRCFGHIEVPRTFDFPSIVAMARIRHDGTFAVELVDLLARVGLRSDADVVIFRDDSGRQLAVPLRHIVAENAVLVLGTGDHVLAESGRPLRLEIAGWTDDDLAMCPVSMRCVTFEEFVKCQ